MAVPDTVTQAQTAAQEAQATADQYTSGKYQIGDVLKQKALDYLNANQDVIKPLDTAQAEYLGAPSAARQMYLTPGSPTQLRDPFAAEKLVSQYVAEKSIPMLTLSSILGQRFGRIQDFIGAGTNAYSAQAATALANATNKRTTYEDLLNQYVQDETLRLRQEEINKVSGGGAGSTQEITTQARASLQKDVQAGAFYSDLYQRYNQYLPEYEIRNTYNAGPVAKQYGPAAETAAQEQSLLVGIPGGTKKTTSTLTPITSTVNGATIVTGQRLKTADGVTYTILPAPKQGPLAKLGIGTSPTDQFNPTEQYNNLAAQGYSDADILEFLRKEGFIIQ